MLFCFLNRLYQFTAFCKHCLCDWLPTLSNAHINDVNYKCVLLFLFSLVIGWYSTGWDSTGKYPLPEEVRKWVYVSFSKLEVSATI